MKNIFKTIALMLAVISCQAQTLQLNESDYGVANNTYFKDFNNELNPYEGVWKANFQSKQITLIISKQIKRAYKIGNQTFYKDALVVRYEVKDNAGQILQNTLSEPYIQINQIKNLIVSVGTNLYGIDEVNFLYAGGNCSVGNGEIKFQKINNTQFNWSYYPGTAVMNDKDCPPGLDYHIYLPETENLVFTKQ